MVKRSIANIQHLDAGDQATNNHPAWLLTAGSLDQKVLIPDVTLSVLKPSIALQSPYMQIRVKLFVLNENAKTSKDLLLHLDPCQSTQPSHGLYTA